MIDPNTPIEELNAFAQNTLPGLLGIEYTSFGEGWVEARLAMRDELKAPNGMLHAGAVVTLADTCCGFGCMASLPDGAVGFTTIELKSNHLGTARDGTVLCRADAYHLGRTTQVWDAVVKHAESDKTIALFRCTQMVLWPKE